MKWFGNDANFVNEVNFVEQDLSASINVNIKRREVQSGLSLVS